MFGSKKTEDTKGLSSPTNPNALNSLVKGTVIEGNVVAESDIRIDGTIKGILSCNAKVIIGPTGFIDGEIKCVNAIIEGKFEGTLRVSELLHVKETADVNGDIKTNKLMVQPGAIFNVACNMTENKPALASKSNGGENQTKKVVS